MNKMKDYRYYVIEFEPKYDELDKFICVPDNWIRLHQRTEQKVVVSYPVEKSSITKRRIKKCKQYSKDWNMYLGIVKYGTDIYKEAKRYIKMLRIKLMYGPGYSGVTFGDLVMEPKKKISNSRRKIEPEIETPQTSVAPLNHDEGPDNRGILKRALLAVPDINTHKKGKEDNIANSTNTVTYRIYTSSESSTSSTIGAAAASSYVNLNHVVEPANNSVLKRALLADPDVDTHKKQKVDDIENSANIFLKRINTTSESSTSSSSGITTASSNINLNHDLGPVNNSILKRALLADPEIDSHKKQNVDDIANSANIFPKRIYTSSESSTSSSSGVTYSSSDVNSDHESIMKIQEKSFEESKKPINVEKSSNSSSKENELSANNNLHKLKGFQDMIKEIVAITKESHLIFNSIRNTDDHNNKMFNKIITLVSKNIGGNKHVQTSTTPK